MVQGQTKVICSSAVFGTKDAKMELKKSSAFDVKTKERSMTTGTKPKQQDPWGWLGAGSWSMSLFSTSIVIAFSRRKSTRLVAVIGGLVFALGILFASFATLLHQVALSYCIVVGFGASMVRDSASVMIGHYFKRRRQFVEMIVMAGEGVGIALFSVILKEGVGKIGWRLGLQFVTLLALLSFFMGLLYRPASLYHPQRRAILHLKNSRKKVKEKKTHQQVPKPPFLDFSPLRSSTVRMLCIVSGFAAFGCYSPIFYLSLYSEIDGYDMQDLVLLQTFLGLSLAVGIVVSGSTINKTCQFASSKKIRISRQYVCQGCVVLVSISTIVFALLPPSYHSLCIITWIYGLGLGGYRYSLKMLALERIRGKFFTRAWGFIKGAESIPVLISIPLTGYLNEISLCDGKVGYYMCSVVTAISAVLMFFIGYPKNSVKCSTNGSILSRTGECASSFRCGVGVGGNGNQQQQWQTQVYYPSTNVTPHHHHHYNNHSQQNGVVATGIGLNGSVGNFNQFSNCRSTVPPPGHGRLQKSLSFAFQTPSAMMNEIWQQQPNCQNQLSSINYPPQRSHSRCDLFTHQYHHQQQQPQPHSQQQYQYAHMNGGFGMMNSRSRSVPEGLAMPNGDIHWDSNNRPTGYNFHRTPSRPFQVLEQITTSV